MRIEQIEIRELAMPLVVPFETSFGREDVRQTIVVAARSEGLVGWGEAATSAGPWYEYETVETCWHVLVEFMAPLILGQEIAEPLACAAMLAPVRGHHLAKMGLESAIWDLLGQSENRSVAQMLGGSRERVAVGVSVGIQDSVPSLLDCIGEYWETGYRRIKIKIRPGWDVQVVSQVRERFGDIPLMADANSAYTLRDAGVLAALDGYELMMIEQPLAYDDLLDHADLQRQLRTPICLDESISSLAAARAGLRLGSCRIINIKPGRVGGLTAAKAIHDLCRQQGVPVWCGGMLETGIGRAHNVALASLPGFTLPGDISASSRYFHQDVVDPQFDINSDSTITVPTGPGIGVKVLVDRLDAVTRRRVVIER